MTALTITVQVSGTDLTSLVGVDLLLTRLTYKHSATLTLAAESDADLCQVGTSIGINIAGTDLVMMVVDVGRSRSVDEWLWTVSIESPAATLDYPFADLLDGYLVGDAATLAAAQAGAISLDWDTVTWTVSGELLDVTGSTPREVISTLAAVPGAVLISEFDGSLTVEPDYPVAVPDWGSATPDYTITMTSACFADASDLATTPIYNAVYVGSESAEAAGPDITISYEQEDSNTVLVRVAVVPWSDTISFDHSGGAAITVTSLGVVTRDETELVEIVDGAGSAGNSIYTLTSSDYQEDDLGTVTPEEDGAVTTATVGDSLVEISYQTRSHDYRVASSAGLDLQVIAEVDDGSVDGDTILVTRGAGDALGDDIVDALLEGDSGDTVKTERGRNYLDEHGSLWETMTLDVDLDRIYRPGALVEVTDPVDGVWRGLLQEQAVSITISGSGEDASLSVSSQLTIDRVSL